MRLTRREQRTQRSRRWIMIAGGLVSVFMLSVTLRWFAGVLMGTPDAPFAAEPTVVEVIDGDTIDVRVGREVIRVRLLGIDTPETKDPRRPVQCFGPEAASRTEQLLPPGTIVQLEADRETHDVFGRTLAHVHRSDGLFVNLSLLSDGFADVLFIAPNGAHSSEFREAATAARTAQKGLWGACGGADVPRGTG